MSFEYSMADLEAFRERAHRREMEHLERLRRAREDLKAWAQVHAERDEKVRAAIEAGLPAREVQRITGIARTTIDRIVKSSRPAE